MATDPSHFDNPLISLVIPVHGRRALLAETVQSLVDQSMPNWEAVVVDDRSPDDTAEWLAQAAARDSRIRPITRTGDLGGANVARNQGVLASRGKYVIFLDSDDLLEPDCLLLRTQILEAAPTLDFTVHAIRCFDKQPNDTDRAWNTLTDEDDFERYLLMDGPWQTMGATWRKTALDRIGPWDPAVLSLQDLDFHARALTAELQYRKINQWDCHYRLPQKRESITSKVRSLEHVLSHTRIAHRLLDLSDSVLDKTPNRRDLLAGFSFLIADRCATKGDLRAGLSVWNHARRRGIARGRRYLQGLAILTSSKRPKWSTALKRRWLDRWPATWRMRFRHTFLEAPLPPKAQPSQPAS